MHDKKYDINEFEIKYSYFLKKILIKLRGIYLQKKIFLSTTNYWSSDITNGGSYLTLLSKLYIWSNLPFHEGRLLWSRQIQNLTLKHWNNSRHIWPISCQFLHAQQSDMYTFRNVHLKAWIPYCWVYQSHNVVIVPQFPCLKINKCERQKLKLSNLFESRQCQKWINKLNR